MKKKVLNLFSIISLLIALLFVFYAVGKVYAYEPDELVDSNWLVNDGVAYQSNLSVGSTSGYGKFVLGEENITLTTNANEGFRLDGWQIVYTDEPTNITYIDDSDLVVDEFGVGSKTIQFGEDANIVDITLKFIDTDADGYFDQGTFNISKVFDNLQVVSVFDYIYYNVEINSLFDISTIGDYSSEQILDSNNTIYFVDKVVGETYTTYTEAVINFNSNENSKLYYYGNLYYQNGLYYTIHNTSDDRAIEQKIDYKNGAFRLKETVEASFDINIDSLFENSINIDVKSISVSTDNNVLNLIQDAESESFYIEQDSYLRTTNISFKFTIEKSTNQESIVNISYHNLYLANIEAYLDGTLAEGENENNVLDVITATFYYSKISDGLYFIKNSADNNSNSFRIVCAPMISKVIDAKTYNYYKFDSIDGLQLMYMQYPNVNQNINIKINYNSISYNINFEFRLYDSDTGAISQIGNNFNLEPVVSLVRGDSITINKTNASDNVGYEFYGFAFSEFQISNNNSIDVVIDFNKPEDYTILMLFEYVDYSIKITNFDQIKLNDGENDYYPISKTTLSITKGNYTNTDTLYADELRANLDKNIAFDLVANIGDNVNLYSDMINGFYLLGYKLAGTGDYVNNSNSINFNLTSDIITQFANDNNEIEIFVYEDYTTYTLTYYIEATMDTYSEIDTIMADLSYITDSQNVEVIEEDNIKYEIIIKGLKLYDTVTLNSKGKTVNNQEISQEYTYMFVRFTENDKTNLNYSYSSETDTYSHVETVLRDISIKVVYTMPSARLQISTDKLNAYDLNNLVIYQDGIELEKTDDSVIVEAGKTIQVVLNPNGEDASEIISFGYRLVGYTFISEGKTSEIQSDSLTYTYTVSSSNLQYLIINFVEIEYHLSILQSGGGLGYDKEYVSFGEENYKVITVDDRAFSYNMPIGYFASNVYFINNGEHEYVQMNQTNEYESNEFSYEFTLQELINLISIYGINSENYLELNMLVSYQIHTYSINIEFELTNPKNNDYDLMVQFPQMTIQYQYDNLPQTITGNVVNNAILFENIPYNSNIQISVTGNIPNGFSAFGWTTTSGQAPSYSHSSTNMIIPSLRQNELFKYKLSYDSYTINLIIDNINSGNPTVMVNNKVSNKISMYDNLKIEMNANKNNGFKFDYMYYDVYTYNEYIYSEESWNLNYLKLYTYSPIAGYVLNTSSEYNPNTLYYTYELSQVYYDENTTFEDTLFNISNYYLEGGGITFYIQYEYLEISLINDSSNYSDVTLIRGDISIDPSQYSTYQIIVTTNGEEHILQENETVNYLDSVDIYITLNEIAINDDETYNLSSGVYLAEIYMLSKNCIFESLQTGNYKFSFNISDIISNVPDSGELTIYYRYLVSKKQITLTTNIDDESFYKVNNNTRFEMSYDNNMFGFDAQIYSSGGQSYLVNNLQFLGKTRINYNFHTIDNVNYNDFFYIANFKIYNEAGELLLDSQTATRTELNAYGISIIRNADNNIQSIDIRFVENIVVKLQVQPQIIYNGADYVDGVYIFTSTFICDNKGNGVAQKLTVGPGSNSDIQSSEFILNFMMKDNGEFNITYYDKNGAIVNPTNVGEYEVDIEFNDTGDYSWLSSIVLDYRVRLVIQPRSITVSYLMNETFTKTYDASSSYDATRLLQYLVFTDGAISINYSGSQFILTQNYSANITYNINGIETPINIANESLYYNITLSGINLAYSTFNNNFVLSNNNVTFLNCIKIMKRQLDIIGIKVNDKVYDGTLDVVISQNADIKLQGIIGDDDVNLIVDNLNIKFSDSSIGLNKKVNVNSETALIGADAQNYKLNNTSITASIYPYSVSTNIDGVGEITITNKRGITDSNLANLIPVGATLKVEIINVDTNEYVNIYDKIVRYLSNSNVFSIGYVLKFEVNGISKNIDNNLYLTVPNEERLTGAVWLTGEQSGQLDYEIQGNNIMIDLNQMNSNVNTIIILEQRVLLELWQIILIVIGSILLIAIIVVVFIIIRRKKKKEYSINDRI